MRLPRWMQKRSESVPTIGYVTSTTYPPKAQISYTIILGEKPQLEPPRFVEVSVETFGMVRRVLDHLGIPFQGSHNCGWNGSLYDCPEGPLPYLPPREESA